MSAAVTFDLKRAASRPCFYTPDDLCFIRPRPGRTINIGPRLAVNVTDAANQTINASQILALTWNANSIAPGSWPVLTGDQAVLFESLGIRCYGTDASGKLQWVNASISLGDGVASLVLNFPHGMPYTAAAITNDGITANVPPVEIPMLVPTGPPASNVGLLNGPAASATLINTDGAASHTYRRQIRCLIRIVSDCDFSTGPSVPGGGTSGEM